MYDLTFTTPISLAITFAALAGVALHDTKLDKLATSVVGSPMVTGSADAVHRGMSSDAHTHVERVSLHDMKTMHPRLAPRHAEQKKHVLQKKAPKGWHALDGSSELLS